MKLILIKAGFTNKTTAALFGMNWQLKNKRAIVYREENFVLFSLYSVYYSVCKDEGLGITGVTTIRKIGG